MWGTSKLICNLHVGKKEISNIRVPILTYSLSPSPFRYNESDLALEAELLSSLVHPNIIKLRGISYGGAYGFEHGPR